MLSETAIRNALRDCYASAPPRHQPVNIVELGLVHSVALAPDTDAPGAGIPGVPPKYRVAIKLLPPTGGDDAQSMLRAQVLNRLAGLPEISRATVEFVRPAFAILA